MIDDDDLTDDEIKKLYQFIDTMDDAIIRSLENGVSYAIIAGALQAKVAQLYLANDDPDFEGFEFLLTTVLEDFKSRPKWDIK